MQPISESGEQILPNIVYSMQPDAIVRVVVDGKLTVKEGVLINISEEEVIEGVKKTMSDIRA